MLAKPEPRAKAKRRKVNQKAAAYAKARALVWERDSGFCRVCGQDAMKLYRGIGFGFGQCHHIRYRSRGGQNNVQNLVLVCVACHDDIHARRVELSGTADDLTIERRR